MSLLGKANKRACYPVVIGETKCFVRSMKASELKRMKLLEDEQKTYFMMGMCLVDGESKPELSKLDGESDADFATRVENELDKADVDYEMMSKISEAIGKIGQINVEDIRKNSETTLKPDSVTV